MREELNLRDTKPIEETEEENGASKEQLQYEMDSARESISQTVSAIAGTVTHQAQSIRETVANKLDWREHAREHLPVVTIGAMALGAIVGYKVVGSIKKRNKHEHTNGHASESAHELAEVKREPRKQRVKDDGPGLFDKLKTTRGYKKLSGEASGLLDNFIDETVNVGKTVLLPLAIGKITNAIQARFESESETVKTGKSSNRAETENRSSTAQKVD